MWTERPLGAVALYACSMSAMDFSWARPLSRHELRGPTDGIRKSEPRKVREAKKAKRALQAKSRRANRH